MIGLGLLFPRVVQGLLVAGIVYSLVDSGAFLLRGSPAAPAALVDDGRVTAAREPGIDLARILQRELFGAPGAAADASAPLQETTVVTSLPLLLHGVFVGDQGARSVALIAQTGRPGAPFGVGDEVPGGATLEDVRADHVLLRRAGALEILPFPRPGEGAAAGRQTGSAYAAELEALPGEAPYDELIEETPYVDADYTDTSEKFEAPDYQVPPAASFQMEERGSADP